MQRNQTLNERQQECLDTCMGSCQNICYPTLGLIEEVGEYVEKLMNVVDLSDKDVVTNLQIYGLLGDFIRTAKRIGIMAKAVRHAQDTQESDLPFRLQKAEDMEEFYGMMTPIWKELGDVQWMLNVCEHQTGATSQMIADMNHEKLQSRKARNVIDGAGDER